ncbi:MAG: septum site-determining protein MinC [Cellulosilyticaceae bacterium]
MNTDNLVIFKGSVDGINVILDSEAAFEEILISFEQKLKSSKKFFEGATASLKFKGRALSKEHQQAFMEVLTKQDILNVSFVYEFEQTSCAKKEDYMGWVREEMLDPNVSLTYFHTGPVRSGQHIHYNGSVVVLGDVNPGGIVSASFNVIVLGSLKGKVHAGVDPDAKHPFIVALCMQPTHIEIKDSIAQSPEGKNNDNTRKWIPQIAYRHNKQIYVDEIDFKTLNHMIQ